MGETYSQPHPFHCNNKLMTKKYGPCTNQELIDWLNKHLDDCPTEWSEDERYGMDFRTAIIFETEEEN